MNLKLFTLIRLLLCVATVAGGVLAAPAVSASEDVLPGTDRLVGDKDFSEEMVVSMARYLDGALAASIGQRGDKWTPDFSSRANYEKSLTPNRDRLRRIIGVVDARVANSEPEYLSTVSRSAKLAETSRVTVFAVRWPVLPGVHGEARRRGRTDGPLARWDQHRPGAPG